MTDLVFIITAAYLLGVGCFGFYLLWSEWQWLRKEDTSHEKRTLQDDTPHD